MTQQPTKENAMPKPEHTTSNKPQYQFLDIPKHPRFINRTGQVYGRLTVLGLVARIDSVYRWLCVCTCGNETVVRGSNLKRNTDKISCGCLRSEETSKRYKELNKLKVTHGLSAHPLYAIWHTMIARCHNSDHPKYPHYGAKGIKVCDRWQESVADFITDVGQRPSDKHTLDRVESKGNYESDNVRWATAEEQNQNRSITKLNKALVIEMRRQFEVLKLPVSEIHKKFAPFVTYWTINEVVRRKTWKNVE